MQQSVPDEVFSALTRLTAYAAADRDSIVAERQGGLTNKVYKVDTGTELLIVRIAGAGTEEYIDRKIEAHNAVMAAQAGVSAEVLFSDSESGLMISRCIPGITTMTPAGFASRAGSPTRAGLALGKLHRSGVEFNFRFELFAMIDEYLKVLSTRDIEMPQGYHQIVEQAQPVKQALNQTPVDLAPCHCDPLCENFLDDGDVMWIVDWEYSGMNDPYWDLGDLSVEGGFTSAQDLEMMRAYCDGEPGEGQMARMIVYKAMCDLLWTLWGLIQHADENPAEDFWAYATGRFERCKALMNSPQWPSLIADLEKGI